MTTRPEMMTELDWFVYTTLEDYYDYAIKLDNEPYENIGTATGFVGVHICYTELNPTCIKKWPVLNNNDGHGLLESIERHRHALDDDWGGYMRSYQVYPSFSLKLKWNAFW